jgi:hypothetical protein
MTETHTGVERGCADYAKFAAALATAGGSGPGLGWIWRR